MCDACPHESRITFHLLFLSWRLLLGHGHSSRSFSSPRVCVSALTSNRQPATVTQAAIAADVHHPLDVHLNLLAQIALDSALLIDDRTDAVDLFLAQLPDPLIDLNPCFTQNPVRARAADSINVR